MHPDEIMAALDRPRESREDRKAVPTGSLGLDLALGGGWPAGRIVELSGAPGTGKTLLAMIGADRAQATGPVLWVPAAAMFDLGQARLHRVNLEHIVCYPAKDIPDALEAMVTSVTGPGRPSLVVMDSATGMDDGDSYPSRLGRLAGEIRDGGPPVIFISNDQVSEPMTGRFSTLVRNTAPVRVRLTRRGEFTCAEVVKNLAAPPTEHQIRFRFCQHCDSGIDWAHELVTLGLETGVLHKRGSWVYFYSARVGQGVNGAASLLRDWPQAVTEITERVRSCLT